MDRSGPVKASIFRTPSGASELCGEHYQGGWVFLAVDKLCCGLSLPGEIVLKAILFARVLATPRKKLIARRRQGDADVRGL